MATGDVIILITRYIYETYCQRQKCDVKCTLKIKRFNIYCRYLLWKRTLTSEYNNDYIEEQTVQIQNVYKMKVPKKTLGYWEKLQ